MAGNAIVGALRVVLGADTAALEKGLKSAQSKLTAFSSGFNKAAAAAGAAALALGTGIGIAVKDQLEQFDKLSKLGQSIGVPVEQLSALKYAAELSDVSLESLGKGIARLARNAVEAGQGLTTPIRAFQALQIEFRNTDGSIKTVSDLLPQIADRFANMADGSEKTAIAQQLLGRAGAELIPLLNAGSAGLKEMTDEARALGLIIDDKTARAAEAFNDNLTRLYRVMTGIFTQVTAQLAPALKQLSDDLVETAKSTDLIKGATEGLVTGLKGVVSIAVTAGLTFQRLGAEASALWQVLSAPNFAAMTQAWAGFVAAGNETKKRFEDLGSYLDGFWKRAAQGADALSVQTKKTFQPEIIKSTKDALESFLASKEKEIAALKAEAGALGQSSAAREKAKIVAQALAIAEQERIPVNEALRAKIDEVASSYSKFNVVAGAGQSIFESTRTPLEQFTTQMERLNMAFNFGARDPDTYARAVAAAQDKLVQATPAAQALGSALESAFSRALEKGAKFSDILRSLLQDLTKAIANQAFRTLLYGNAGQGGTSSGLLGGLFAGGGLPRFASGGIIAPGGAGGIDSQVVSFRKSPSELVAVGEPGQFGGGGQTIVQINNYAGDTETRQSRQSGPDGDRVIVDIVKKKTATGQLDDVMRSRFGLRPIKSR